MMRIIPKQFIKNMETEETKIGVVQDYHYITSPDPSLQINSGGFQFRLVGREKLQELKELLEFALEVVPRKDTEEGYRQDKYGFPPKGHERCAPNHNLKNEKAKNG
tara:strand:+ start:1730 stop:2047 length:318 start_codon:yes stop_codon:yes gene_type:complete